MGTQKNRLNEHPKHIFKLMGKQINAVLSAQTFLIWTYDTLAWEFIRGVCAYVMSTKISWAGFYGVVTHCKRLIETLPIRTRTNFFIVT